jgi:hypothetical protein
MAILMRPRWEPTDDPAGVFADRCPPSRLLPGGPGDAVRLRHPGRGDLADPRGAGRRRAVVRHRASPRRGGTFAPVGPGPGCLPRTPNRVGSHAIALPVATAAQQDRLASPRGAEELERLVDAKIWQPRYFAGDRGFLCPELTRSATEEQVEELKGRRFDRYVSSNRTCEIGMNLATGQDYRSVTFLLEELTRTES